MGCDITLFAEIKIQRPDLRWYLPPAPSWQLYSRIPFPRWYGAFEKLAGVRGDVSNAIAAPRGLPLDVSVSVDWQACYDGRDGHSHSWISASEIEQFTAWFDGQPPYRKPKIYEHFDLEYESGVYFFGNSFADFKNSHAKEKGVLDLRFVFWFDN